MCVIKHFIGQFLPYFKLEKQQLILFIMKVLELLSRKVSIDTDKLSKGLCELHNEDEDKKAVLAFGMLDFELWGRFNQRVAKIKGFPLYEKAPDKRTERQKSKATQQQKPTLYSPRVKPTIIGTFKLTV